MTEEADRTYPTSDSLGAEVYQSTEGDLDRRFERLSEGESAPRLPPLELISVRTDRLFGGSHWRFRERQVLVSAQFRPMEETPSALLLGVRIEEEWDYLPRLSELGFPVPETDPAFIVGDRSHQSGRITAWVPGPSGLETLFYRIRGETAPLAVDVCSEAPPDPELTERKKQLSEEYSWDGTAVFTDLESLEHGDVEEVIPSGSLRARMIL